MQKKIRLHLLKLNKLHRVFFYILVFFLPVNLGIHFIFDWNYVAGILVDYLIPTIYFQDILILLILVLYFLSAESGKSFRSKVDNILGKINKFAPSVNFFFLFVFVLLLSVISSVEFYASLTYFLRVLLYFGLFVYVLCTMNKKIHFYYIFSLGAFSLGLVSLLGIFQWLFQGSVFDNYLFFGEQPYTDASRNILTESIFGVFKVPPYGLFRHPNIFGGFISIVMVWSIYYISLLESRLRKNFYLIIILLGICALFLTFSFTAWASFLLGAVLVYVYKNFKVNTGTLNIFLFTLFIVSGFFLPYLLKDTTSIEFLNASFSRRVSFWESSLRTYQNNMLFGTGVNTNTILIEEFLPATFRLRFVQPVHNIFLLYLTESGIFALTFFVLALFFVLWRCSGRVFNVFCISLVQTVLIGSFDHYFATIHQTQILMWLTLGLALTYNFIIYEK